MDEKEFIHKIAEHRLKVSHILMHITSILNTRRLEHDLSKLVEPELSTFLNNPLEMLKYGTPEYEATLNEMMESGALAHHYKLNRHHPEFYPNGIDGMTLIDLTEMVADWMAASQEAGRLPDLEYAAKRFGIEPQLLRIIANTIEYLK